MTCPRCGAQVPDMRGHFCPAVWRTCNLCGERYKVSRDMATTLREAAVSECQNCSPGLHRRYG